MIAVGVDRHSVEPERAEASLDLGGERTRDQSRDFLRVYLDPSIVPPNPHSHPAKAPVEKDGLSRLDPLEKSSRDRVPVGDPRGETRICRLFSVRKPAGAGGRSNVRLRPAGPRERVSKPGLVHRPEARALFGQVVQVDSVEELLNGAGPPEPDESLALHRTAEVAPVRRIRPVFSPLERVDFQHDVRYSYPPRDRPSSVYFAFGDRGSRQRDGHGLVSERVVREGRHDRRVDPTRESDQGWPCRPEVGDDLLFRPPGEEAVRAREHGPT